MTMLTPSRRSGADGADNRSPSESTASAAFSLKPLDELRNASTIERHHDEGGGGHTPPPYPLIPRAACPDVRG
jgi:hypothetical protein